MRSTSTWPESAFLRRQPEFVPHEVHQIGGVFAIVDGERRHEPDEIGVIAQQPRADAMKRAGPGEPLRDRALAAERVDRDARHAPRHFEGRAAQERQQQNAMRIRALHQQMRDAMRERVGLARSRARDHEQRATASSGFVDAEFDGRALCVVELREIGRAVRISGAARVGLAGLRGLGGGIGKREHVAGGGRTKVTHTCISIQCPRASACRQSAFGPCIDWGHG